MTSQPQPTSQAGYSGAQGSQSTVIPKCLVLSKELPSPGWKKEYDLIDFSNVQNQNAAHQLNLQQNAATTSQGLSIVDPHKPIPSFRLLAKIEHVKVLRKLQDEILRRNGVALFNIATENSPRVELSQLTMDNTWDDPAYVRLPSNSNFTKKKVTTGVKVPKWEIIHEELEKLYNTCTKPMSINEKTIWNIGNLIQQAITQYNSRAIGTWNFDLLKEDYDLAKLMFNTLPIIIWHALQLPTRLSQPIPLLKQKKNETLYFSRNLVCSIVANFFFCTFPQQPNADIKDFNFIPMFNRSGNVRKMPGKIEKLKCILEYFNTLGIEGDNDSIISYQRRIIWQTEDWALSNKKFCKVGFRNGKIETAHNMLQVDFANKFVGGGVLNEGLVMEEIRFVICPELLAARLLTERLDDNEVLVVTGIKQYSNYTGYGPTFKFSKVPARKFQLDKDPYGRDTTQVVAMDAVHFRRGEEHRQYAKRLIDRELHKCRVAFCCNNVKTTQEIATGNWGCGAFNGDPELKFIIQWIAASHVGRPGLIYHTLENIQWEKNITEIYKLIKKHPIGYIYMLLLKFENQQNFGKQISLFNYFKRMLRKQNKI